ncbi:uncharacterized protein V6R79_015334 [Siganus canaliculatus]
MVASHWMHFDSAALVAVVVAAVVGCRPPAHRLYQLSHRPRVSIGEVPASSGCGDLLRQRSLLNLAMGPGGEQNGKRHGAGRLNRTSEPERDEAKEKTDIYLQLELCGVSLSSLPGGSNTSSGKVVLDVSCCSPAVPSTVSLLSDWKLTHFTSLQQRQQQQQQRAAHAQTDSRTSWHRCLTISSPAVELC